MILSRFDVLRAPDDGTGAPAAVATPAATPAADAAPAAVANPVAAPGAAAAVSYRPDGLPDHLFGGSDKDTLDKLWKAYGGARDTIAQQGAIPKDAAGYKFEPSEAVKPYAAAIDNDPFFGKVRDLALKNRIPAGQFNGFLNDIMGEMIASDLVAEPFSAENERANLVPSVTDPKQRQVEADRIVRENIARVNTWKEQGMPDAVSTFLLSSMDRAAANHLVGWIAGERSEVRPAIGGAPVAGVTSSQLDARVADPRNNINSPKFDRAFAAETTEMFKKAYPGERG